MRQVQLGKVAAGTGAGDFAANVFCPAFVPFAACTGLVITVQPVTDFYTASVVATPAAAQLGNPTGFCVGLPGQLMFARAVYLAPVISQFWPYAQQASIGGTTGNRAGRGGGVRQ